MESSEIASALGGGVLIGVSASLLLLLNGRVAGVSGMIAALFRLDAADRWPAWFIGGLLAGGLVLRLVRPGALGVAEVPLGLLLLSGLLVGFGARLGGGCTSGHGVCGIARLSRRSVIATLTFMASAVVATYLVQHLLLERA